MSGIGLRYSRPYEAEFGLSISHVLCSCGFHVSATGLGAQEFVREKFREHAGQCGSALVNLTPLAGHAGACDKVTRAQTHGDYRAACSCGREEA